MWWRTVWERRGERYVFGGLGFGLDSTVCVMRLLIKNEEP